ncbi:MAG: HAMP domain-containing histidine kinase [Prevotella sp.]|nr:HAMP domain-containing histidine kinase [Prevotella sp.]
MKKRFTPIALLVLLCLTSPKSVRAAVDFDNDPVHKQLYHRFLELYSSTGRDAEFYRASDSLAQWYRDNDLLLQYYKMQLNICLYDTESGRPSQAMERANRMLHEMEAEHFDAYSQVYTALGTIYESRGNLRMARYYYEESINSLDANDQGTKMSTYSRLAFMLMLRDPVEAEVWNEKYRQESLTFPPYHQVYLAVKAMIAFAVGNQIDFENTYQEYHSYHEQHQLDNYGKDMLETARLAFQHHYDEALSQLAKSGEEADLNTLSVYDMRVIIYKMMGRLDLAMKTLEQRAECVDSLNSDMIFDNLNQINAATGLSSTKAKAAQQREQMLIVVLLLATVIIILLAWVIWHIRRSRLRLKERNEQLRSALAMAEEGEKMKTEFVRSVSHEIRTPLNAINGFNNILNTPGTELSPDERQDLLKRIADNVKAITNIVDDMLRVADKESNEFYPKSGKIYCNQFFSGILYEHRDRISSAIELNYTTKVINRFQIETNIEGLRKIMDQLIQNAIKFTKEGFIHMHCEQDGNQVLVSVEDSGCGIDKDQQDKIFEGFYKGDTFEQGMGLGLTVSKKIARKLGGDLVLDTQYTGGARFVLHLPVE